MKSTEKQRAYWKARFQRLQALKPKKQIVSKYRFKNDGNNKGITVHKLIAEKVLGRRLPKGAEIHHVDGNWLNNDNSNLVICPSRAYHALLHIRSAALESCGNANWLRCIRCKNYDDQKNMHLYIPKDQKSPRAEHRYCMTRRRKRKEV